MEIALPKIRLTDTLNKEGSIGNDSPTTTTEGGPSSGPLSATSSEGTTQLNGKKPQSKLLRNSSGRDYASETPSSPPLLESTAIDPLSHHILKRTHTEKTIPQKLRNVALQENQSSDLGGQSGIETGPPSRQMTPEIIRSDSMPVKKKGVSFLSRFSIGGKKKDQSFDGDDAESEVGDPRPEGMNAHVFSSSVGANGYIPQHKEPPRYIKVRSNYKKVREFDRMFLAQELCGTKHESGDEKVPGLTTTDVDPTIPHKLSKSGKAGGAVWATEFSKDGKYLAAAGRDQVVRIWAVISTPEERREHELEEDANSCTPGVERLSAPVFRSRPIREFEGHTGDILDLSWSKNNFLLSSSMDKSVRLWHISRQECLCTFKHKDFVTSIAFHPTDDRFFLAGSLDSVLRLWSIPDKSVAFWNQLPDLITAVAFTPDGKTAMAGVLSGLCLFYETEGLKYHTQIHVRSSRGKNAKGSKITGIRAMTFPPDNLEGEMKILISSNDSRVRVYNLRDKSLEMKFRGHENTCSQINASFSDDGQYVICGSEDHKTYIWSTAQVDVENKDKRPLELFEAHSDIVTTAIIAPLKSRQLLSASGDPIYDLCNPPPITLLSREESNASSLPPPADTDRRYSGASQIKKPEETPAYLARCTHFDGHFIITADYLGTIKVFRQDCAFHKRRQDNWETGSMFSKRGLLGRSNSIMTRNSGGSHSRRNSASQNSLRGSPMPSNDILSWRNSVTSTNSLEIGLHNGLKNARSDRSMSPAKITRALHQVPSGSNSQNNLASTARQQPYAGAIPATGTSSVSTTSPPASIHNPSITAPAPVSLLPTPGFSLNSSGEGNPLKLDAAGSRYQFWNKTSRKSNNPADPPKSGLGLKPPIERSGSAVSNLSSDISIEDSSEGEPLKCRKCGNTEFRTRRTGKGQSLVCTKCGMASE